MFRTAIVRRPCSAMIQGLTTSNLGKPVFSIAIGQHQRYCETLDQAGLKVKILPANEKYPDSTFIEDVALCTDKFAAVTLPGAQSRKREIEGMHEVLKQYYNFVEEINEGTIEAGDIMMVGDHFYIGLSARTNNAGANSMIKILGKYGYTGSCVPLKKMLHLKSGVSYLENNVLLVCGEFINAAEFREFDKIIVDDEEAYAANSLWLNGKVLVPDGFPKTREKIEAAGYSTVVLNVSEFRKLDGGLSCLSLRF